MAAKVFSCAFPRSSPSLFDCSSNMSLIATSLTKSVVVGLMPSVELTPVFSPTDWARAGPATRRAVATRIDMRLISGVLLFGFCLEINNRFGESREVLIGDLFLGKGGI